jgi:phenylpyruvate tautomerase PptA (4-oxalocrotonate tautomerase family)
MSLSLIEMYFVEGDLTEEKKIELSKKVTDLIAVETGKPYAQVIINEIPKANWISESKAK